MSYLTLVWFSREALLSYLWHLQVRLLMKEEEEMEAHPELRMQMEEERRQQDRQQHEESENMLQMIHQKQQQQATDGDLATPHGFSSIPQATESSTPGVTPFRDPNDSATSLILEEEELMESKYTLEVTSPGVDFPLSSLRQYRKNVGRKLRITLKEGKDLKGVLKEVDEQKILIDKEVKKGKNIMHEPLAVAFDEINKTIVQVSFK